MAVSSLTGETLERLIDAIARDRRPPTATVAPAAMPREDRIDVAANGDRTGIRGSAVIGFVIPVAILGGIVYAYVGLQPMQSIPGREAPARRAVPPLPSMPRIVVQEVPPKPVASRHIAPSPPRRATPIEEPPETRVAAEPPVSVPDSGKAVHLTGAALEAALAEDRIKTRQLNLEALGTRH